MARRERTRGEAIGGVVSSTAWPLAMVGLCAPGLATSRAALLAAMCTLLLGGGLRRMTPFPARATETAVGAFAVVGTVVLATLTAAFTLGATVTTALVASGVLPDGDPEPLRHGLALWFGMAIVFVTGRRRWAGSPKTGGFIDWLR